MQFDVRGKRDLWLRKRGKASPLIWISWFYLRNLPNLWIENGIRSCAGRGKTSL